jgi:hypothetical protein
MAQALRLFMLLMAAQSLAGSLLAGPVLAGPVVCTTTIEAPQAQQAMRDSLRPVELTRCGGVQTTPQLVEQRFYSYSAPFARGVDITHQITDLLGISMGGGGGTKVMGFGFPDQTIVWDGTALDNTYQVLLEKQGGLIPWRTGDVGNGFSSSLGSAASSGAPAASFRAPVRGLW